jgi:hypothetical protein
MSPSVSRNAADRCNPGPTHRASCRTPGFEAAKFWFSPVAASVRTGVGRNSSMQKWSGQDPNSLAADFCMPDLRELHLAAAFHRKLGQWLLHQMILGCQDGERTGRTINRGEPVDSLPGPSIDRVFTRVYGRQFESIFAWTPIGMCGP